MTASRLNLTVAVVCCLAVSMLHAQDPTDGVARARLLWERAINAKGGREALERVTSILQTETGRWKSGPLSTTRPEYFVRLLGLPEGMWLWNEEFRSSPILQVVDFEPQTEWSYLFDHWVLRPEVSPGANQEYRRVQAVFFLETRWVKPTVSGSERRRVGLHQVDVVMAVLDPYIYEYYLDPNTGLPDRVREMRKGKVNREFRLTDYRTVEGVRLPHSIESKWWPSGSDKAQLAWELNIAYDREIFRRQPSFADGPDGWRHPTRRF